MATEQTRQGADPSTVTFLVGPDKVVRTIERCKLKKLVRSPEQLDRAENTVDMDPTSFQVFFDMVEGNGVAINSPTIALNLVEFADKICCLKLHYACNDYLKSNYKCDRALSIYKHAKSSGLPDLAKSCFDYIEKNLKSMINSEEFLNAKVETVAEVYSGKILNMSELDLLKALIVYAKRRGGNDIRSYMKMAVEKIRFEQLDAKQLLQLDGIDLLLDDSELLVKTKMAIGKCKCVNKPVMRDSRVSRKKIFWVISIIVVCVCILASGKK